MAKSAGASSAPHDTPTPAAARRLRVWDLPTRLFHWTLAASVIASIVTAKVGGNATVWHFRLGYLAFALLSFRLLWGVMGGHWSRFGAFVYGPGALWRYLRGASRAEDRFDIGHSPLGSLSVWALLLLLALQVATGLVADDEIANVGPLNRFVSGALASQATGYHKAIGQWVLIGLVVLHVGAVLFYLLHKRRNLVAPMLHGDKVLESDVPADLPPSRDTAATRLLALGLFAACAAGVAWVVSLGG
ncbi:cytochrome b/b6 domain-containing protein [Ideonella sp. BN130291]|uniref:cytochrome b/b6 domain-containing protein n=1 Tax=Ideonella sp. BN130291 TaxID=3112940 RepID=UPI002E261302|nr:cytochrome b/b6 domain-containing protein [Ideonella sp. BN130291]